MKKHIRFLASALSLVLTVSLCAPALAAGGQFTVDGVPAPVVSADADLAELLRLDPEDLLDASLDPDTVDASLAGEDFDGLAFLEEYTAAHQEEYDAFDADAWFAENYPWWSKKDYMKAYDVIDDEDFRTRAWGEYVSETEEYQSAYAAWSAQRDAEEIEAYRAAHPGELEALSTAELLARKGYRDPMEAYMEEYGCETEEEAERFLLLSYIWSRERLAEVHAQADAYRASDPDSWAGFDPDAYLAETWSLWTKEKYMEIFDLYTEEDYADSLYVDYMGGMPADEDWQEQPDGMTLYANGTYVGGESDGVVILENGVCYTDAATLNAILGTDLTGDKLPIRQTANDAGWDVVWNGNNAQAALVDRESLMAALDEKLGGLDALLTMVREIGAPAEGKSLRTVSKGSLTLTMFDSLDGDTAAKVAIQDETLQRDGVVNETMSFQAGELLALLPESVRAGLEHDLFGEDAVDLDALLNQGTISAIQDQNGGALWFNASLLSLLDETMGEDAWVALEMEETASSDASLSEVVYQNILDNMSNNYLGVDYAWESSMESLERLVPMGEVTLSGGGLTRTVDTAAANAYMAGQVGEEVSFFKECEIKVSITPAGKLTLDLALRLDMDGLAAANMDSVVGGNSSFALLAYTLMNDQPDFRLTCHVEAGRKTTAATMELHIKNQFKIEMEIAGTMTETADLPLATPPEGAQIIEM